MTRHTPASEPARLRNRDDAAEVFAQFSQDFWLGLPRFEWKCSARVWAYKLARNAALHYVTAACRRPGRHVPLSEHPALDRAIQDGANLIPEYTELRPTGWDDGSPAVDLYWLVSAWDPYNVVMLKTRVKQ